MSTMSKESCEKSALCEKKKTCPCILNEKEWLEDSERKAQKRDRMEKEWKERREEKKTREIANH